MQFIVAHVKPTCQQTAQFPFGILITGFDIGDTKTKRTKQPTHGQRRPETRDHHKQSMQKQRHNEETKQTIKKPNNQTRKHTSEETNKQI